MEQNNNKNTQIYTIDLMHIVRTLWHRAWLIALAAIIAGVGAFCYATFKIAPTYSASVYLYVNNGGINLGDVSMSITTSDLAASRNLVSTYSVILESRTTMERVIEKCGVPYSPGGLAARVQATRVNETEVMRIIVTTNDPYEAADIANCIAEVLPSRIAEIIDGTSVEVVDYAVPNINKVAPDITRYTTMGLIAGAAVVAVLLAILAILDNTIHSEEYVINAYNYPILAKIPDLTSSGSGRYGYRRGYYRSGYYKRSDYQKRAPYENEQKEG